MQLQTLKKNEQHKKYIGFNGFLSTKGGYLNMIENLKKQGKLIIQGQYIEELINSEVSISKFRLVDIQRANETKNEITIVEEEYSKDELIGSTKFALSVFKGGDLYLENTHLNRIILKVNEINPLKKSLIVSNY